MATNDLGGVVQMIIDEIWNKGALDLADELFTSDYVNHGGLIPDLARGPDAIVVSVQFYRLAFPSLRIVVEDLFTEGDMVVLRWAARGRHSAEIPAKAAFKGVTIGRFTGVQVAESWTYWDAADVPRGARFFLRETDLHGAN